MWRGEFELSDSWAVWRGAVGDGAVHRHFAAQAVVALEPVSVFDSAGACITASCVLVEPFALHRLAPARHATIIYVEPTARITPKLAEQLRLVHEAVPRATMPRTRGSGFWSQWLSAHLSPPSVKDERILSTQRFAEEALRLGAVSLAAAARHAGLSPDRFRHLFVEQVGVPFRRWLLWRRLRLAAEELLDGSDATTAAHAAGFADSAHFARTMQSMFGVTAGQTLLR